MLRKFVPTLMVAAVLTSGQAMAHDDPPAAHAAVRVPAVPDSQQVFYHVFMRSMRDSNGDGKGDLQGLIDSLDYLRSLGVNCLLLTPLYPSDFYHNYFAYRFEGVDPAFGTMADFRRLVAALHARGMKIFLDEEIQYTEGTHPWFTESLDHPDSRYADFILYRDADHMKPVSGPLDLTTMNSFDNPPLILATVNLKSPQVQAYFRDYLLSWMDLDGSGHFNEGVDGFRIDHMMDNLDDKGVLTHLFTEFWRPLFAALRKANPNVRIIAEQADWGDGHDFLSRGNADAVFAFPLHAAIRSFDKSRIVAALRQTTAATPPGKRQLIFVENHDMDRVASDPGMTPERLRTIAALNLLLADTPIIYYGQELGMRGRLLNQYKTDELGIGVREAFRWMASEDAPIQANWYRGGASYWTQRFNRSHDGVSVEEEDHDPASLLNRYRQLIRLRHAHAALNAGSQQVLDSPPGILVIQRSSGNERLWLVANLSDTAVRYQPPLPAGTEPTDLLGSNTTDGGSLMLKPYQTMLVTAK